MRERALEEAVRKLEEKHRPKTLRQMEAVVNARRLQIAEESRPPMPPRPPPRPPPIDFEQPVVDSRPLRAPPQPWTEQAKGVSGVYGLSAQEQSDVVTHLRGGIKGAGRMANYERDYEEDALNAPPTSTLLTSSRGTSWEHLVKEQKFESPSLCHAFRVWRKVSNDEGGDPRKFARVSPAPTPRKTGTDRLVLKNDMGAEAVLAVEGKSRTVAAGERAQFEACSEKVSVTVNGVELPSCLQPHGDFVYSLRTSKRGKVIAERLKAGK